MQENSISGGQGGVTVTLRCLCHQLINQRTNYKRSQVLTSHPSLTAMNSPLLLCSPST